MTYKRSYEKSQQHLLRCSGTGAMKEFKRRETWWEETWKNLSQDWTWPALCCMWVILCIVRHAVISKPGSKSLQQGGQRGFRVRKYGEGGRRLKRNLKVIIIKSLVKFSIGRLMNLCSVMTSLHWLKVFQQQRGAFDSASSMNFLSTQEVEMCRLRSPCTDIWPTIWLTAPQYNILPQEGKWEFL